MWHSFGMWVSPPSATLCGWVLAMHFLLQCYTLGQRAILAVLPSLYQTLTLSHLYHTFYCTQNPAWNKIEFYLCQVFRFFISFPLTKARYTQGSLLTAGRFPVFPGSKVSWFHRIKSRFARSTQVLTFHFPLGNDGKQAAVVLFTTEHK